MQSRQGTRAGSDRPKSSLSEHVAREIQRDYPLNPRPGRRHEPLRTSAGGIKRFMFATAGGVKRISVATGRRSAKVGGTLKRSATGLAKMAYKEWKYSDYSTKNSRILWKTSLCISSLWISSNLVPNYCPESTRDASTESIFHFFRACNTDRSTPSVCQSRFIHRRTSQSIWRGTRTSTFSTSYASTTSAGNLSSRISGC